MKHISTLLIALFLVHSVCATAQISDQFYYKGERYSLIGKTEGVIVHPSQFGMKPIMIHTGCYRGFYASFELTDNSLLLQKLTLRVADNTYLPINGVEPDTASDKYQASYTDLNMVVKFTGKIRLAKDFMKERYIHMGYQRATAFKTVLDITIVDGKIVEVKDRSEEVEKLRNNPPKESGSEDLEKLIADSFKLDMKMK